ncbi:hypothetical protein Tco_0351021, partial [Tanacetum coccineum]
MLTLGELSMIMARISSRNDPTLCFDDDDVLSVLSLDIRNMEKGIKAYELGCWDQE